MKRKIRLSPLAQFDLEATYSYIEARHPRAAQRWLQELEQFFNLLLKNHDWEWLTIMCAKGCGGLSRRAIKFSIVFTMTKF